MDENAPESTSDLGRTWDLIRRAKGGDDNALEELIGRYYERVRAIVRLRLGGELRLAVESGDIVQDTFARAVRIFDRFELMDEASLINWLAKIAQRQILAEHKRYRAEMRDLRKQKPLDAPDSKGHLVDPAGEGPSPSENLARYEDRQLLEDCIRSLPEKYRESIILRDYLNCDYEQIAAETDRPSPDAARMLHNKALLELQLVWRRRRGK